MSSKKAHVDATQTLEESTVSRGNYVFPKGKGYIYRRRVPNDLIQAYGKKEIQRTLKTSDRREAERRARAMSVEDDEKIAALRAALNVPPSTEAVSQSNEYEEFLAGTPDETLLFPPKQRRQIQLHYDQDSEVGDVQALAARILQRLRVKREEAVAADVLDDFLRELRLDLAWDTAALKGDADLLYPAWQHEAYQIARQQLLEPGRYAAIAISSQMQQRPSTQAAGQIASLGERTSLDKLVEYWKQDGSQSNVRTLEKVDLVVRRFKECVGNLPVQVITRKHCVEFRDKLRNMKAASGKPLSVATVNDNMDKLRALLAVAKRRSLIEQNPAEDLSLADPVRAIDKRQPFDVDALVRIFSSRIYSEGFRPSGGKGEAAHWLPLLALFTGARLEELGQLRPEDVRQEEYEDSGGATVSVWVIHITEEGEGQGLKNTNSIRRVPLHSELIRLGFVEFVESRRGRTRVFYELKKDTRDRETGNWSKWFGNWLRGKCGVTDKRMVFHSFRHTLKDLCRIARIPTEDSNALTGHSGATVAEKYGGSLYPLEPLADGIKRIRLPVAVQAVLNTLPKYRA